MWTTRNTAILSGQSRQGVDFKLECLLWAFAALFVVGCDSGDLEKLEALESAGQPTDIFTVTCSVCHGVNGEGKPELFSPSIAGLPWWYVEAQMKQFRDGHRGVHPDDLPGMQMHAISLSLTDEQIKEVSQMVAAMPPFITPPPAADVDLKSARYRYANECMACHRYNGTGDRVFQSAPLITLDRAYLERQLKHYRDGLRGAVPGDLYGVKMVDACRELSDEDILELVDYIGALANGDDPRVAWER